MGKRQIRTAPATVELPLGYEPRPYQREFYRRAVIERTPRICCIWHRRAGKDVTAWNSLICRAISDVGIYYYILPTYSQGRKILWDGITNEGKRMLEYIPQALTVRTLADEMKIELRNGSLIQILGSDMYDRLMGTNPKGVVFSEYALQHPLAWEYVRPILAANGGWAVFLTTPRGRNHAFDLYEMAEKTEGWWAQRLTVDDTHAISTDAIQGDRESGMPEELIQQEYYCSWDSGLVGSYYAKLLQSAQITRVPLDPAVGVETWWDLGIGDATAIWFSQRVGQEIHLIDYYEASGEGLPHYARVLQEKGYVYSGHHVPHDAQARELGTGKSRVEIAAALGMRFEIVPSISLEDGIEAVRVILPRCWFDAEKCKRGLQALREYHAEYNDLRRIKGSKPVHDWSSHAADSFRYLAVGWRSEARRPFQRPPVRGGSWMSV